MVTTDFLGGYDPAYAVALQPDGKIITAGSSSDPIDKTTAFTLARYDPLGTLDPTFGAGGKVGSIILPMARDNAAHAITLQPDGKILAAGYTYLSVSPNPAKSYFAVLRYMPDGSLDPAFGSAGIVITSFGENLTNKANAIIFQGGAAPKILVAGRTGGAFPSSADADFGLVQYNLDGSLNATFGTVGKVTTDFLGDWDTADALVFQADGKILAGGTTRALEVAADGKIKATLYFAMACYNSDGKLDATFGIMGKVITDVAGAKKSSASGIALQPDGMILLAGFSHIDYDGFGHFAVARYRPDGGLDPVFGIGGKVVTVFPGSAHGDGATSVAVQPDGKIVLSGLVGPSLVPPIPLNFALVRYDVTGGLDPTFGAGGTVATPFGMVNIAAAHASAIQPDGKIILVGVSTDLLAAAMPTDFALARYCLYQTVEFPVGESGDCEDSQPPEPLGTPPNPSPF